MSERTNFPFSAIVSMEDLKLALIVNAINPKIGGLLIRGPKGSGKTTAVRALAEILPTMRAVKDCPFNCNLDDPASMCEKCRAAYQKNKNLPYEERRMRVVDLPLGATEDAVVGSLDVEKAIKTGIESFKPGVLAEANHNILYIDEVNLLPDHIADDLLDSAATGWNIVEREGVSFKHPSRFILVGTMNPEEGQIRPQLLDRFGLSVEAKNIQDVKDRVEIVKRNLDFDADAEKFLYDKKGGQVELMEKIAKAKQALPSVEISDRLIETICATCVTLKIDGVRPDIVISKTAKSLAALVGKESVLPEHVLKAAELALNHRTREGGFLEPATTREIRETLEAKLKEAYPTSEESQTKMYPEVKGKVKQDEPSPKKKRGRLWLSPLGRRSKKGLEAEYGRSRALKSSMPEELQSGKRRADDGNFQLDTPSEKGGKHSTRLNGSWWSTPRLGRGATLLDRLHANQRLSFKFQFRPRKTLRHSAKNIGKRIEAFTAIHRGRALGWKVPKTAASDIHFPATIRQAAARQNERSHDEGVFITIQPQDVREKLRVYRAPMTVMFVLDLSESMLQGVDNVRDVMLNLHNDAYRFRDRVGLVAFKEMGAVVVQHPTSNLKLVANRLLSLGISGFTPLAAGMLKAVEALKEERRRNASTIPVMTIVTDGDANVPLRKDLYTGEIRDFHPLDVAFFKHEREAQDDAIAAARIVKKEGINTVVINMAPLQVSTAMESGGLTTREIASITDGIHYHFPLDAETTPQRLRQMSEAISEAQNRFSIRRRLSPPRVD